MKNLISFRLVALLAAMMCALGASAAEAYACYTSTNTTLTFYYDNQRDSRPGTTYDLNTGSIYPDWVNDGAYAYVTNVVFMSAFANARPTSTANWFNNMQKLESITDLNYLNTSEVTNMGWMFSNCETLWSLDLSSFNTSKVTEIRGMFNNCSNLSNLDLSSFNTSNVTELDYMFHGCSRLTKLDLSSFNTSKVTNMNRMFYGCSKLRTIYAGAGWSTSVVTMSSDMFYNCSILMGGQGTTYDANHVDKAYAHLDGGPSNPGYFTDKSAIEAYACYNETSKTLTFYYDTLRGTRTGTTYSMPGWNTPGWYSDGTYANVTKVVFEPSFADYRPVYTYRWFESMYKLESITDIEYLNTENVVDMRYMFSYCTKLTSLDVSHFNTSKVTNMASMFWNCSGLTNLDLSSFNTSKVTNMAYMFSNSINMTAIYVGEGWSTAAVTNSTDMFKTCTGLVGGQGTTYDANHVDAAYAHLDGGPSNPGYFTAAGTEAYACYTPGNTTLTFYYDNQRSSRPGTKYNLNTGDRHPQWYNDNTYRHVTLVKFDASFANARPTTTYQWFYGMNYLLSITGLNNLNTSKVTNMSYMFTDCTLLTSLNLSGFNTSLVTEMIFMFNGCSSLISLDLGSFNTSNVTRMNYMFWNCSNLTSLDLSSFNTSKVTDMYSMFAGCGNLQTITVGSDWSTAAVTSSANMFNNDTCLVGGQGTTYDANHVDKAYAHIDGGASNPGYFTATGTEAYACYTPGNTTLTFYHDNQRDSRTGTTYNLNTGANNPSWYTDGTYANVTRVVFDPSFAGARPTTTYYWFYEMQNLQTITGLSYLNTSEVNRMSYMFYGCNKFTSLDLSSFNTSKVTIMWAMFHNCTGLTSLDLSSFNTSQVTSMGYMFRSCSRLRTIYVGSDWSTAAVTQSTYMFEGCPSLVGGQGTTYDANHIDKAYAHIDGGPSNPGYFTAADIRTYACYTPGNTTLTFYHDNQRDSRTGTIYNLNTGENTPAWRTDGTNANVTQVVFDPSFANARPTTTYLWFYLMKNLQTITGIEYLNTSEVTNMANMFNSCSKLTSLDLSTFNTSKVTDMRVMFYNCSSLTSLDLSSFNTANVTSMFNMFGSSGSLRTIYVGDDWSTAAVTNSSLMFTNCTSLLGGHGTTYDSSHIDKAYAHVDGGPSDPGYFTAAGTEAYVVYTPENTTLTFYYDTERSSRPGTTYDLNTGSNDTGWESDETNANVTQVVFDPSFANARPTTTYSWFYNMQNLQTIEGIEYLNTSEVTDMNWMFGYCTGLTSLDLSNFNTSKVTSMARMFAYSSNLTSLDLRSFNTSKVTSMTGMFRRCGSLRTIYAGDDWSTAAVTYSQDMFGDDVSLVGGQGTTYDASHIDQAYAHIDGGPSDLGYFTAAGTEAYAVYTPENTTLTFYYDTERSTRPGTTYDLNTGNDDTGWDIDETNVNVTQVVFDPSFANARPTTTYDWFYNMQNLQTIEGMEYLNTSEVTSMLIMFAYCTSLTSIDLSHFNTAKVTDMGYMFYGCTSLTSLDLSSFNTSNVTIMNRMFYCCFDLTTIYAGEGWSTEAVTNSTQMFQNCTNLVGGQGTTYDANHIDKAYAHLDGGPSNPGYFTVAGTEAYAVYTPENTTLTFYYDTERSSRPGTTYDLNTGENDPGWKIDDTIDNVTQVVFDPSFANARPTTTYEWFFGMQNLQTIEGMEYLNTSEVTDMSVMFAWCSELTSLDLSHFNTAKVTNMGYMFYCCSGLTSLDLSSFNTSNVTYMNLMLYDCSNLTTIYAGEGWSTEAVTSSAQMFNYDTSLVGGMGTVYNESNPKDKTYAHIDGGPSNPGYFTDKNAGMRGDVNGDGSVSIGDVTALIDYLLSGDDSGINLNAADCNLDTGVSIGDVTALIDYLLSGSW